MNKVKLEPPSLQALQHLQASLRKKNQFSQNDYLRKEKFIGINLEKEVSESWTTQKLILKREWSSALDAAYKFK